MKPFCLIIIIFLMAIDNVAFASYKQTFAFTLVENRIVIKVETNNGILNLLFDTGSDLSILDSIKASQLKLPFLTKTHLKTPAGKIVGYWTKFSLFNQYNMSWITTSLSYQTISLNYPIHGLLGVKGILQKEIIDIDFENQKIHIYNPNQKLQKKYNPIYLINGNRSQDFGIGSFFSFLPAVEGNISFKDNHSKKIDLIIDTGCQYDFALISQDSLIFKLYANEHSDYFLLNGKKVLIHFGNAYICNNHAKCCEYIPFFYDPNLFKIYRNESIGLIGIPILKKYKRIIINWPGKVMYVKKIPIPLGCNEGLVVSRLQQLLSLMKSNKFKLSCKLTTISQN